MRDIDNEAYSFVERLVNFDLKAYAAKESERQMRGAGTEQIADLGEIELLTSTQEDPLTGEQVSYYETVGKESIGLDIPLHKEFSELIVYLMKTPAFKGKSDYSFMIENACRWLLDVYKTRKANQGLTSFLLSRIEEETHEFLFGFRMDALQLEFDFTIGETTFRVIDEANAKRYIDEVYEEIEEEQNPNFWKSFTGEFAIVKYTSTFHHARQMALRHAELCTDVLKCFCADYTIFRATAFPELEHRKVGARMLNSWDYETNDPLSPTTRIKVFAGNVPIQIDKAYLESAYTRGLADFSIIISKGNNDLLYSEIEKCIRSFSSAISTIDNHEKISKIISLLEGPLLNGRNNGNNRGETKLKSAVEKFTSNHKAQFRDAIHHGYSIRNAFLHNGERLLIDTDAFRLLLMITRLFIWQLIKIHNRGGRTYDDIINYFLPAQANRT